MDQKNLCFVCGLNRAHFEQKGLNFDKHQDDEHDKFKYSDYILYLGEHPRSDLSGLELFILECYENSRIAWIPQGKSKYLEKNETSEQGSDKIGELEEKINNVGERLSRIGNVHNKLKN